MADLTNRSRYRVTVKDQDEHTAYFPFSKLPAVKAYRDALRAQGLQPDVEQLDESWLVRIRQKGLKQQSATFSTRAEAADFLARTAYERDKGLFVDYFASVKITFAELLVRYLLEEAPRLKSYRVLAYTLEGWLTDSGPAGIELLCEYREELRRRGLPVRTAKFQMRKSSDELAWIHKPFSQITTVDIETFINDRLEVVKPGTVDREIDRLKGIFKVATVVWDYPLAKNPMSAVRRPKYFNERDRRISESEESRLLEALAKLDQERAVELRLCELAAAAMAGQDFTSDSARKKGLAKVRSELRALAEESAEVVPYLQVFYLFQVMTAARRGEAMSLPWKHIDFEAGTAFLPETKNGRARKLSLRDDLLDLLRELPRDTDRVFAVGLDYIVDSWNSACEAAGIEDLHIHDARHEALSRLAESGEFELAELKQFSGHRDTRMLMRYAHLCASRLAKKLNECFKDATKYRVHRGRKVLNREASMPPSKMTKFEPESPAQAKVEDVLAAASAAPQPGQAAPPPAVASTSSIPADAKDHPVSVPAGQNRATAKVIAFPSTRMAGTNERRDAASEPLRESAAQTPSAG